MQNETDQSITRIINAVYNSGSQALSMVSAKSTTANVPSIGTGSTVVLETNSARKSFSILNLGTNILYVRLSDIAASSTVFHAILEGGVSQDDGSGGFYGNDVYVGPVSVSGSAPRYVVTELS